MSLAAIIPIDFPARPEGEASHRSAPNVMRSDLVEQASKLIPHPPLLINAVSQRVRQLNQGRSPMVDLTGRRRLGQADIALLEIIEGKVIIPDTGPPEPITAPKSTRRKR
jgi:DNA-directed RNA polymerase subunit omega